MAELPIKTTNFGFDWGGASVERICDDLKKGWVIIGVKTKKYPHHLQIYVTKTGKVRVVSSGVEWLPKTKKK